MAFIRLTIAFLLLTVSVFAQQDHKALYIKAFDEQSRMLEGTIPTDFKRAVFISENCYYKGQLNYDEFNKQIKEIGNQLNDFIVHYEMTTYKTAGNWAVFTYMTEGTYINNEQPFTYDFEDYFGDKDFSKMFVTKLLKTKSGNCHSLPYLYKILCEEIGAKAQLALTPNHVYIKHISEKGTWTNVELTNSTFPKDKWIIKDIGLYERTVEKKLYMNALSDKESIALTLFDLSNSYESQFGMDSLYLTMVETALRHFPNCVALLMSKANYYAEKENNEQLKSNPKVTYIKELQLKQTAINNKIYELGHEEMPLKLYKKWMKYIEKEKAKEDKKKMKKAKKNNKKSI